MSNKAKILVPFFTAIILLYIILAAKPLQKELHFIPAWTLDIDTLTVKEFSEDEKPDYSEFIPFKLGQTLGYFTSNGNIVNKITFPYKAAVSKTAYAVYGTSSEKTDSFLPDGKKQGSIPLYGFPYFTEYGNFLFYPGGSSFSSLNETWTSAWKYEGFTPITAFSVAKNGCAAGFANGTVVSFDRFGNIEQQYNPGGSSFEVILGLGISNSSQYIATLSGLDSQRFVIAKKSGVNSNSQASIIFYKTMQNEINRQALIKFTKDEERVFYDCGDGLGIVNLKDLRNSILPVSGKILSILESENGKQVFVLSKEGNTYTVSTIQSFDVFAGSFSYEAGSSFIAVKNDSLFVGKDSQISKIDIIQR